MVFIRIYSMTVIFLFTSDLLICPEYFNLNFIFEGDISENFCQISYFVDNIILIIVKVMSLIYILKYGNLFW